MSLRNRLDDLTEEFQLIQESRKMLAETDRLVKRRNPYQSYNYVVKNKMLGDADVYRVWNRAGIRQFSSGYPEVAIQEGLDSLRNGRLHRFEQEKVKLDRDFHSIGATLQVENYTIVELIGAITLANGVNDHILENKTLTGGRITIQRGDWDGNSGNQSSGNGFNFLGTDNSTRIYRIRLMHCRIHDIKDHGVHMQWASANFMLNVSVNLPCYEDGFYLQSWVDSRSVRCGANSSDIELHCEDGSCCSFVNWYLGGTTGSDEPAQLYINGLDNSEWSNIRVDNPLSDGVELTGDAIQNLFHGLHITVSDYPADNTKDGLVLGTGADFNTFSNFYIGRKRQSFSNDWRYGVNEGDGEYNAYACGLIRNCQTGTKTGISGNSKWDTNSIIEV